VIRKVLESIPDIGAFPSVSLVIFLLVFLGLTAWALSLSRHHVVRAGRLPLEDDSPNVKGESRHET
jgi:cbb3-type cytochrome oxidase subunit 3